MKHGFSETGCLIWKGCILVSTFYIELLYKTKTETKFLDFFLEVDIVCRCSFKGSTQSSGQKWPSPSRRKLLLVGNWPCRYQRQGGFFGMSVAVGVYVLSIACGLPWCNDLCKF